MRLQIVGALALALGAHLASPAAAVAEQPRDICLGASEGDAQQSAAHTAEAIAIACTAAGQTERLSPSGSPNAAQALLRTALFNARRANRADLAAQSAYQLGLASLATGTAIEGSRGVVATTSAAPTANVDDACGSALGERGDVSAALRCAAIQAIKADQLDLAALAQLRLARLLLTTGREQRAGAIALNALPAATQAPAPARSELLGRLIEVAIDAGHGDDPALRMALADMRAVTGDDPGARAFAAALSGRLALQAGDPTGARAAFQQAVFLEGQRARPDRLPVWQLLLAQVATGPAASAAHVDAAIAALRALRPTLPLLDPLTEEANFALLMRPVFEAAVAQKLPLLSSQASLSPAGVADIQALVEEYRQAELQSAFGGECVPPSPQAVRPDKLRTGELILYPIVLPDRLELLYAKGGTDGGYRRLATQQVARDTISSLVTGLVASSAGRLDDTGSVRLDDAWQSPARDLYRYLIGPIAADLSPETTLVIVPDGALRAVPFAALLSSREGEPNKFLIEQTRIASAPALAFAQTGSERAGERSRVVAASLQREVQFSGLMFKALQGTVAEARIAANGPVPGALLEDFTRARLVRELARGRVDVLHLATHATFNGGAGRSFIVAAPEPGRPEDTARIPLADLRDMIARSRVRGDALDLLVLSACETAVGDDLANMGLAGAAVQAGARSVLASLWAVNDASTAALVTEFYGNYRQAAPKAEALRLAQRKLIDDGYGHPHYWAAFSLIGGWR